MFGLNKARHGSGEATPANGKPARQPAELLGRVLQKIARQERLEKTLDQIAELAEWQCAGTRGAVLLLRNARLYHAGTPRLPESFLRLLEGLPIGAGAAASAPFWASGPLACEIAGDPRWAPYREAAGAAGLQGCWSHPVFSAAGEILGTLVLYLRELRQPSDAEWEALRTACLLCAIAIEQRNLVEELCFKSQHDPLTKVCNRTLLEDRLRQAISLADHAGLTIALLSLDLDRFKAVNDMAGQKAGDALLAGVARRLEGCIRRSDTLARTGGDEFTILLAGVADQDGAEAVAEKIVASLQDPFLVGGHELFVTASIGVSLYPGDAIDAPSLEQNAADAMYRAKLEGRNNFLLFEHDMSTASRERLELEAQLRGALERGEFLLHYQPQISLRDGSLAGVESLIRWRHPKLGMVSPASFIPMAEENGLIVAIGDWVLKEACAQIGRWRELGMPPFKTAVNVSAVQFARPDFVDSVTRAVAANGIDPRLLELELTESAIVHDVEKAARQMQRLRDMGICTAIDDFGTGYASLSYLQKLPIDVLKLDQVFTRELGGLGEKRPLVQSIVALARALGKSVIAEGVETTDHLQALVQMDCDMAQGYLLGRPMDAEALLSWRADRADSVSPPAAMLQTLGLPEYSSHPPAPAILAGP